MAGRAAADRRSAGGVSGHRHPRCLHIAEYATLHEMPDLVLRAKAKGLTVSLDPSWDASLIYAPGFLEACRGVDVFLPNQEEAEAITGSADPQTAITLLGKSFPTVALKGGDRGAWVVSGFDMINLPAKVVPVVGTTGAGDAFNAGFLDAWLNGHRCVPAFVPD
jgi:sugar/nucleoside kinase (ribokinase family)